VCVVSYCNSEKFSVVNCELNDRDVEQCQQRRYSFLSDCTLAILTVVVVV
jgi:hypothetical protein